MERERRKKGTNAKSLPESRMLSILTGGPGCIIGFLIHGWTFGKTHWIIPSIGQLIFGISGTFLFNSTSSYLIDIFPYNSASVTALNNVVRSLFSAFAAVLVLYGEAAMGMAFASCNCPSICKLI